MAYDESGRAARCRVVTALLAVALIVLVGANLCIGSVLVPADHIPGILSGGAANSMESQVIWEIRLPRVLSAVLLGGAGMRSTLTSTPKAFMAWIVRLM